MARYSIMEKDLTAISEEEMCKIRGNDISMIFQDPMTALNPVMTIGKQISEVIAVHEKVSSAEAEEKMKSMLTMVGIDPQRAEDYPHQFSGGMKQRVVIAIALACNPNLLVADEPTTALDVTIQAQVLDLIKNLREKLGTSLLLITHDLGVVATELRICSDYVCWRDYRIWQPAGNFQKTVFTPYTEATVQFHSQASRSGESPETHRGFDA